MSRRRVLVVNDDGAAADGLGALVRAAAADERNAVVVAAPAVDSSSTGTALGAVWDGGIAVAPGVHRWPTERVEAVYEVSGYPAAIVTLAVMGAFGPPPELVLAGINHGHNVGRGLVHSSTIGAALTAAVHRVPAVALSAPAATDWADWSATLARLVRALPDEWPDDGALTVNLPGRPPVEPPGVSWSRVAEADAEAVLRRVSSADGPDRLRIDYRPCAPPPPADTDVGALGRGLIAISWLALPYGRPPAAGWVSDLVRRLSSTQDSRATLDALTVA